MQRLNSVRVHVHVLFIVHMYILRAMDGLGHVVAREESKKSIDDDYYRASAPEKEKRKKKKKCVKPDCVPRAGIAGVASWRLWLSLHNIPGLVGSGQ